MWKLNRVIRFENKKKKKYRNTGKQENKITNDQHNKFRYDSLRKCFVCIISTLLKIRRVATSQPAKH